MIFASWLATMVAFGAIAWGAQIGSARTRWKSVGSSLGLRLDSPLPLPPVLRGRRRGCDVEVTTEGTGVALRVLGVDPWFTLGEDSAMARAIKPDIETGVLDFDDRIRIEGDRDFALGLLHAEARRVARFVVLQLDGRVENGQIEARIASIDDLESALDSMIELAQYLDRPLAKDLAPYLARNALEDPSKGFRLQALRQLANEFAGTDELRSTARLLVEEEHLDLRVEAADILLHAGSEEDRDLGAETLRSLAGRTGGEIWLRRLALERLMRGAPAALTTEFALGMVRRLNTPPELRRPALGALIAVCAVDELLALEPREYRFLERVDVARGLGACGDPRAQPRLLEFLEYPNEAVRVAAARSLGAVGDLNAVPALRRAAAGSRTLLKSELARVAEQAVNQIQERAGFAQAGEISIVDPAPLAGAVSPVSQPEDEPEDEAEGGEMSLVEGGAS